MGKGNFMNVQTEEKNQSICENEVKIDRTTYRVKKIFKSEKELKPVIFSWIVSKLLKLDDKFR